ncbi:ER membrane protein complex subunit 6 [Contarinia nasturtii]|uniref:ER membrane protein complex subunit 6 n=1 Tax=Contarinia nasturtii TaxID=265458 RepID=UPI0012D3E5EF|nr:ER membrane protein complex subunit 6 [Contarinia nasturtii]
MSNRVRTRESKSGETVAYSESAIRHNASAVEYCRTSMAALSGSTAGIMGLTGIIGFLFYLVSVLGLWCLLLLKTGSNWKKFFINRQSLLTNGFLGGLCTYVLFWTFLYGMVHVY